MKIVTGYAGEAHITSNDDQGLLQGIFGSGSYILPVRGRFAATLVSSNELQISDGEGVLQGVHFRTEPGTTDSVTIENGTQGMQRIDLICARYQKDAETGIETMTWINHKGTPAASNPATPSITSGDLLAGDTLAEFPVYSVRLNGITVQSVTLLATIISTASLIGNTSISGIGDGTITGALSALNASLSNEETVLTHTYSGVSKNYYFDKIGRVILFNAPSDAIRWTGAQQIGTLPEKFRPYRRVIFPLANGYGASYGAVIIENNGIINVYSSASSTSAGNFAFSGAYLSAH